MKSNNVVVGGTSLADRNLISGNSGHGIEFYSAASEAMVRGNYIGTTVTGSGALGNAGAGIDIRNSGSSNTIGGTGANQGNLIANNGADGVFLETGAGSGNRVLGNAISGNGGQGIDLGSNGVTANDTGDADSGVNSLQNFPVLTKAVTTGTLVQITGTLNSTASSYFRLEFFGSASADATGYGEGQTYLGFLNVATNASGNTTFDLTLTASVPVGSVISATATKSTSTYLTFTDTSEFAQNVTAALAPYSLRSTLALDAATGSTATTTRTGAGVTVAVIDSGLLQDGGGTARIKTTRDFTGGSAAPGSHLAPGPPATARTWPGCWAATRPRSRASPRACSTSASACSTARARASRPRDQRY